MSISIKKCVGRLNKVEFATSVKKHISPTETLKSTVSSTREHFQQRVTCAVRDHKHVLEAYKVLNYKDISSMSNLCRTSVQAYDIANS